MNVKDNCEYLRRALKGMEEEIRKVVSDVRDHAEMFDHAKLALRHIEDVRMRLGKVMQYHDDGVSIYDKPPYAGAAMPMPGGSEVHPVETTDEGEVVAHPKVPSVGPSFPIEARLPANEAEAEYLTAATDPDDVVDAPHPADEAAAGQELHPAGDVYEPVPRRSANPIPRDGFTYKDKPSTQEDKEADVNARPSV
jgi:hypothetical protein